MKLQELEALVIEQGKIIDNLAIGFGNLKSEFEELASAMEAVRSRVEGRNRSSSMKRDMTDDDAIQVMTGDFKDFNHKTAAEAMALTYAQVYSCRFEYTFKHVHKQLRDAGWKNPWIRK